MLRHGGKASRQEDQVAAQADGADGGEVVDVGVVGAVVDLARGIVHLHPVEGGGDDAEGVRAVAEHPLQGCEFFQIVLKRDPPGEAPQIAPLVVEHQEIGQGAVPVPVAQEVGVHKHADHRRGDEDHGPLPDPPRKGA